MRTLDVDETVPPRLACSLTYSMPLKRYAKETLDWNVSWLRSVESDGADMNCSRPDDLMAPGTTGHFLASEAWRCSASPNSAIRNPNPLMATTNGDTLGFARCVDANSVNWCRPMAEPNTIASTIAVPMPRHPHMPLGR